MNNQKPYNREMYEDILVIIPAYNEESMIGGIIKGLKKRGFGNICVINDGSSDKTSEIAVSAGAHVIDHLVNIGVGGALSTGFQYALTNSFKYAITVDGDGQHSTEDVVRMANELLKNEHDFIIGDRLNSMKNVHPIRYLFNTAADILIYMFTLRYVRDTQSGLRGLGSKILNNIELRSSGYEACSEMIILASHHTTKIKNIPINAIYTRYSLLKGQKLSNSINLVSKLFLMNSK